MIIFITSIFIFLLIVQYYALSRNRNYFIKTVKENSENGYIYKVMYNPPFSRDFKYFCIDNIDSEYIYNVYDIKEQISKKCFNISNKDRELLYKLINLQIDYIEW